nr:DMT family transporter [Thalassobacillus pellis]
MKLYAALIGLSLIWGLSFVFIKLMVEPAGVWGTVFLRCLAGVMILLPFLWMKRKSIVRPIPWKSLIIVGIFNAGLPWGLISLSETEINSSTAAVLNALTPICTGLIGYLVFAVSLKGRQWLGIILGFIGIMILMDFNVAQLAGENFIGVGTMVLATICYGFASQYTKKNLREAGVLLITAFSLLVGGVVGGIGMMFTEPIEAAAFLEPSFLISLIGLGCFGSGIAHLLFYYMTTKRSAEFATSVTYLIPVTAMVWGHLLLGDAITKNLIIGLLIIFLGVYLATRKPKRQPDSLLHQRTG